MSSPSPLSTSRAHAAVVRGAGPLARLSLEYKLPLLIGGLLLLVIAALSAASYVEVRRVSLHNASDRLGTLVTQFRDMFALSGTQIRAQVSATAAKPMIARAAAAAAAGGAAGGAGLDPRLRETALAQLEYAGPSPDQVVGSELRDAAGRVILHRGSGHLPLDSLSTDSVAARALSSDSAALGRFHLVRDTLVYAAVAPVRGTQAYVVHWRRLGGSRRAREQLSAIMGSDAALYLGNADGSLWTDLERPVAHLPIRTAGSPDLQTYTAQGGARHFARAAAIPGTSWMVVVDAPFAGILAPADEFLRRVIVIALVAIAVGLVLTWLVSRHLTTPIADLTDAAAAITAGDFTRVVFIPRADELGRLGQAFNSMSVEVQQARYDLERKVEERTRDLNDTLTQLHDAQETLVRREKLALLGQLASGVGHELRNPLGVMTNAIYYLKMVLSAAPETVHEYLGILQQQITLSEKIVSDLLDFARSKPPQRQPASLAALTRAQIERLGPAAGARIVNDVPESLPDVLVDETQVGQIMVNLFTNALQAMDGAKDGTITVRARADQHSVSYEVSDSGPGIPAEHRDKIFEPLFTTKARGIGLGLAVSRTLARANSGDLTLGGSRGKGATFNLTLPIANGDGQGAARGTTK